MRIYSILLVMLLFVPLGLATQGQMVLLAVSETPEGYVGGTADLFLEIKPGSGRVFLETFPFTKVDTQMSTRFANEIACDYLEVDCSEYDFFYTIVAGSAIVAGPSAGAAMAMLTIGMLEGDSINQEVAITGTINSGGLIGPVGGLSAKIEAGAHAGLDTILVPKGATFFDNLSLENQTIEELSQKHGVNVQEISTIDQALWYITGRQPKEKKNVQINPEYTQTMEILATQLCDRTDKLQEMLANITDENITQEKQRGLNLTESGEKAFSDKRFYSAASYCYGANVEFVRLMLHQRNLSQTGIESYLLNLQERIAEFNHELDNYPVSTITDLEAYMIVKERLSEAEDFTNNVVNNTNDSALVEFNLAWATERLNSAESWSTFLGMAGKEYQLDSASLAQSCNLKIAEVEQRIQYIEEFVMLPLEHVKEDIEDARAEHQQGNFELCLFKASKAKASVGVVLGVFGVQPESYEDLLNTKLSIVEQQLASEAEKGTFPILGYSYYEYANSLSENDMISALLYSEYALELGNIDIYFNTPKKKVMLVDIDYRLLSVLLLGIVVGFVSGMMVRKPKKKRLRKW